MLHWLKDNCTSDTGSYLLVREKESKLLQVWLIVTHILPGVW